MHISVRAFASRVVLSAVEDLFFYLPRHFRMKKHIRNKGFANKQKRYDMKSQKVKALKYAKYAFSFIFDDTYTLTSGISSREIIEMVMDTDYLRRGVIARARREFQPEALDLFERALIEVKE
jgi:hypothetical protein